MHFQILIVCIDEIDKMPTQFQYKLLNFMKSGHIEVDQMRKSYDFEIKGATNDITCLSRPLQSCFRRIHLPEYTEEQFLSIAVKVLSKLKDRTARIIGSAVSNQLESKDVRDVISIRKLVHKNEGPNEIEQIIKTVIKCRDA
jgi:MoxR-like ATPase